MKILIYEPELSITVYKYSQALSKKHKVWLGYQKNDLAKKYSLPTNHVQATLKLSNASSLLEISKKYDILLTKNIHSLFSKVKKKNTSYLLLDKLHFDQPKKYNAEKIILRSLNPKNVIFLSQSLKDHVVKKISPTLLTSPCIPNVAPLAYYPKKPCPKLSSYDGKIHMVLCSSLRNDSSYKDYSSDIKELLEHEELILHIVPTKTDFFKLYPQFNNHKKVTLHSTISYRNIHLFLSQFDVGLMYCSKMKLETSMNSLGNHCQMLEQNVFYDFLFAGVPVLTNDTLSYQKLLKKHNNGITIKSLKNIVKKCRSAMKKKIKFSAKRDNLSAHLKKNKLFL